VRVISRRPLRDFWERHSDAEEPLLAWYREADAADWHSPAAVKARYPNASILRDNRIAFNIKGNSHRVVVKINYPYRIVYVRFVGTHSEYETIDAEEV
jgi:mRNA interferase HigB